MLAAFCNNEESSCAKLLGTVTPSHEGGLISNNTSLISNNTSLISTALSNGGLDTCSFYEGPSDSTIIAVGESYSDVISFSGGESCGSIAYSGGESCGSIASSAGSFSGGSSSSGGCSYSC